MGYNSFQKNWKTLRLHLLLTLGTFLRKTLLELKSHLLQCSLKHSVFLSESLTIYLLRENPNFLVLILE